MTVKAYLALVGALALALILVEGTREQPLDLSVRLERQGAAPFDAEVFSAALPDWLGQPVEPIGISPFDQLADSTVRGQTYLFLSQDFVPDPDEASRLLRFVARGNTVVVAAHDIRGVFGDSLAGVHPDSRRPGVRTQMFYGQMEPFQPLQTSARLDLDTLVLVAPGVRQSYRMPVRSAGWYLVGLDSARTEVLGTLAEDRDGEVSLARVRWGRGQVILSSTPLAFSNAALTGDGDGPAYVAAVLAALPDQPVWWDDYRKGAGQRAQTPLRYVLATPALRWAYALLVLAGVLYLAFRARRWQRPIPVVAPPPNAQREFARTVGRLHFVHRDDARLAQRQAQHVLDRLRADLRVAEPDLSPDTARRAAARAGVPPDEALALFATLARVQAERRPDADTLIRLDGRIARFFRHVA